MRKKKVEELEEKIEEALAETKTSIAPLEFREGLHVSREEFNHVVAKLNEIIKKVN